MRWDGTVWHAETVPFAPGDTTAFRLASNRWGTGLQGRYLYTRDSSGTWSYYSQGGDVERRFSPIADGTIASVSQWESMDDVPSWQIDRLHRLSTLTDSTQLELSEETYWESSFPLVLLSLADGRLVIGTADHGDPSVSGWLQVWSPPFRRSAFVRVELPRSSDITSLAEDGTYLYVAGSGDFLMRVRLDSLPGRP